MAGAGWNCAVLPTCTNGTALSGGSSYNPIAVTVNVAANAGSPLVNQAGVSGGGSASANTIDSTIILNGSPVLGIAKSHNGNFTQGQQGATYTITVSNAAGAGITDGTVTVTESVPAGLTLQSMAGAGWNCAVLPTCTNGTALAGGSNYNPITVTVNVSASASSPLVNQASVSGGGSASANASDPTTINGVPTSPVSLIHAAALGRCPQDCRPANRRPNCSSIGREQWLLSR